MPSALTIHHARELAETEHLQDITHLDLSLSPTDQLGRLGDLDERLDDPCTGLDLIRLSERLPNLQSLRISGCQTAIHVGLASFAATLREIELADIALDGVTIGRISQLEHLHSLTLARVTKGSDSLSPLAKLPITHIRLVELERDSPLSQLLGTWPQTLTHATIEGEWAGHKSVASLAKAKGLRVLVLKDTRVGNYSLNRVKPLKQLTEVHFEGTTFNDNTPLYLRDLPIQRFECACPSIGDQGLRHLRLVSTLRRIALPQSRVTSAGFAHLSRLEQLEDLVVRHRPIDSVALEALAKLPNLRRLELGGTRLDTLELEHLDELHGLEILHLNFENLDDRAARRLSRLTRLRELDLGGTQISDAALESIGRLVNLVELQLHHTRVTNRGLAHLASLQQLQVLTLDHTDVVDEGVKHLEGLYRLRDLRLDSTLVTDRSIDVLVNMESLERLNLANTVITAEGSRRLARLPHLTAINLEGTRARLEADP
jgi:Leucine-rich repeat (LRR) protein